MPEYKLVNFDCKGRAEMTRMIFAAAGVKYEDCRLARQKYEELKASGKLPFGQLPVLEVDGEILPQSMVWFAPTESFEVAKADVIAESLGHLFDKAIDWHFEENEETKQKLYKELFEKSIPRTLENLDKILKSCDGKYFVGNKLTYADIIFFSVLKIIQEFKENDELNDGSILLDKHMALKELYSTVSNNPGINKWLSERPLTKY
ncbi:Glutathione S-transferase 1 [Paramuricea clavata]|uniref:glutathione transferase n=1 Tax=Paramuricea clavata TaxID=317549 RepID=A0A7D9E370_PARCT|nr:Glutathione S-transferase 1 [Paramuricea clavata]